MKEPFGKSGYSQDEDLSMPAFSIQHTNKQPDFPNTTIRHFGIGHSDRF